MSERPKYKVTHVGTLSISLLETILKKMQDGYDVEVCDVTAVPTFFEIYSGIFEGIFEQRTSIPTRRIVG